MDVKRSYEYFITALNDYIIKEGHGAKSYIGNNIGKSGSFIGQIIKKGSPKKASLETQILIADFIAGSYEKCLQHGQELIEQKSDPLTEHRFIQKTEPKPELNEEDVVKMDEDVKMILQDHIETLKQNEERGRLVHESAITGLRVDFERERQAHERVMADLRADLERERQEHKDALAELREDYKELKAENKELRLEYKQLLDQYRALKQKQAQSSQSPDKPEEKKAVNL